MVQEVAERLTNCSCSISHFTIKHFKNTTLTKITTDQAQAQAEKDTR